MSTSEINELKAIGVEVSATAFRAVCVGSENTVLDSFSAPMVRGDDTLPQLAAFIKSAVSRFGPTDCLGLTIPGLIDRANRRIVFSTLFPEHQETEFLGELESTTGMRLTIENDANAAAYGEFVLGAGRGSNNMFYATLSAGVGGAFVFDGKIWHGANGFAGEFGYLAIDDDGRRLEDVASSTSIVRRTRSRFQQDNTSSLDGLPGGEFTVADVVREAREGDDFAHLMLQRTGRHVGTAIAGVINLLNVERIVIGGEVVEGENTVIDAIVERARELSFKPSFESASIVVGELGSDASAIGAALLSRAI